MTKRILAIILFLATSPAWAGSGTVNYNSTGSSPFQTTTNGSSNNLSQQTIWDQAAGANGLTVNSAHALLADPGTAAAWNTTWAGGTLGAMANYGTSPGAVLVPGVNASVTASALPTGAATSANQTNASQKAQIVDGSGNVIASTSNALNVNVSNASTDPCTNTKVNVAIATSSGTVQLVAPSGSTQVYVCSFSIIGAATAVINLVGGTGATCTTGTPVAAIGSTTAASGMSLPANGGLTFGSGLGTVARTTTAGHGLCLIQSGTTALAGNITYVQQ